MANFLLANGINGIKWNKRRKRRTPIFLANTKEILLAAFIFFQPTASTSLALSSAFFFLVLLALFQSNLQGLLLSQRIPALPPKSSPGRWHPFFFPILQWISSSYWTPSSWPSLLPAAIILSHWITFSLLVIPFLVRSTPPAVIVVVLIFPILHCYFLLLLIAFLFYRFRSIILGFFHSLFFYPCCVPARILLTLHKPTILQRFFSFHCNVIVVIIVAIVVDIPKSVFCWWCWHFQMPKATRYSV